MLILKRMREFVRHYNFLFFRLHPAGNIKFFRFRIVQTGDLLGQKVHQESVKRKILRQKPEFFQHSFIGITLLRLFTFFHLLEYVRADFFA